MSEKKTGRGRPSGAANKPKFLMLPVSVITATLRPEIMLPVAINEAEAILTMSGHSAPVQYYLPTPATPSDGIQASEPEDEEEERLKPEVYKFGS